MNGLKKDWCFLVLLTLVGACDDKIDEPKLRKVGGAVTDGAAGNTGMDSGPIEHQVPPQECTAECCPMDTSCYAAGNPGPGAECMAQRDNTGKDRWQLRQTMSISTKPIGNSTAIANNPVPIILLDRSRLPGWDTCNDTGASGFIQLVDFDLTNNIGRVGFAKYITAADLPTTLQNGLCMVSGTYAGDPMYQLDETGMTPHANYPVGLPPPMALATKPWTYGPSKAARLMEDFDLKAPGNGYPTKREEILARLAPDGDLGTQGYTGVFFLDPITGFSHGYSPLSFIVVYDNATQYNVIPIREPELTAQLNDPDHPNCVGVYGQYIDKAGACKGTVDNPSWGCANNECAKGQGPNVTKGYFLISEMEQVYNPVLMSTLCVAYQGGTNATGAGWNVNGTCRGSTKWNPSDPMNGTPRGDWCAATNSPGDDSCHDAFQNVSYATFQAFNIQDGCCGVVDATPPAGTCPP